MLDEEAWNAYVNRDDEVIAKALRVFKNHAAFPRKPQAAPKSQPAGK